MLAGIAPLLTVIAVKFDAVPIEISRPPGRPETRHGQRVRREMDQDRNRRRDPRAEEPEQHDLCGQCQPDQPEVMDLELGEAPHAGPGEHRRRDADARHNDEDHETSASSWRIVRLATQARRSRIDIGIAMP
jgi:hypothetical protein